MKAYRPAGEVRARGNRDRDVNTVENRKKGDGKKGDGSIFSCRAPSRTTSSKTASATPGSRKMDPSPFSQLRASLIFSIVSLASPKTRTVLGIVKSSFSMPAKPGFIERLSTMQVLARSALSTGMP
jgi:hypothetical protein